MRTTSFAIFNHPGTLAKIDLQLGPRLDLHAAERQWKSPMQALDKPLYRMITAGKLPLDHQVLVDPLRRQSGLDRQLDLVPPRLAQTGPASC